MKIIHISALHLQYKMQKDNPSVTKFKTGNSNRNTPFLFKHKRTSAPWKFSGTSPQEKQFQKHWALKYLGLCASKQRALQPRQKANRKQECWQASPARWGEDEGNADHEGALDILAMLSRAPSWSAFPSSSNLTISGSDAVWIGAGRLC